MLSIFDIYKIGVGPSSSHTNGPMIAAYKFTRLIEPQLKQVKRVQIDLYGSLSLTGIGHHTDRASILGLLGNRPDTIKITSANQALHKAITDNRLLLAGVQDICFNYKTDMLFNEEELPLHENGMKISAFDSNQKLLDSEVFYSIGGGFIATEKELTEGSQTPETQVKHPFKSADEMLALADKNGLSLGAMIMANELAFDDVETIDAKADQIWRVMTRCMERGFETEGILEGGLNVTRRAPNLLKKLEANSVYEKDPMEILDWVNLFAFSVSEENASGGQVVTSPTNGGRRCNSCCIDLLPPIYKRT